MSAEKKMHFLLIGQVGWKIWSCFDRTNVVKRRGRLNRGFFTYGGGIIGKELAVDTGDVFDGGDLIGIGWVLDKIGNSTLTDCFRRLAMLQVELIGVLLHFRWLEIDASNPTLIFAMIVMSAKLTLDIGSLLGRCG